METSKNIKWAVGIVAAIIVVAAIVVYPKLVVTLPNDGADAKPFTFKDTRGHRYTEMFLIGGNGITKDLKANVYNTWGLNGGDTTGDSVPRRCWTRSTSRRWRSSTICSPCTRTAPACGRWTGSRSRWARSWTSAA